MMNNGYNRAINAYQKNRDESLTPLQIVVELYKGMIKNVREAKKNYDAGHLDLMTNNITKVFNIIEALQANLDVQNGGEDAQFLDNFYNVIFLALSRATFKPDPSKEFEAIANYIQQVHDRWYAIAYVRPSGQGEEAASQG